MILKLTNVFISIALVLQSWPLPVWLSLPNQSHSIIREETPLASTNTNSYETLLSSLQSYSSVNDSTELHNIIDEYHTGSFMSLENMQSLQTTSSEEFVAYPLEPLSISRQQSTYVDSGTLSQTIIITFTISNNQFPINLPEITPNTSFTDSIEILSQMDFTNDPNTIYNILLTDEIVSSQATLLTETPTPSANNNMYSWEIGHLSPLEQKTIVLEIEPQNTISTFVELDTGATAWGTSQGTQISNYVAPIHLFPHGYGEWLDCTIDANCLDEYIVAQAAQLQNDPNKIFEYVQSLDFESYKGSLRGARGTLWSQAGNSVDQASLLVALLRASGYPANYSYGQLDTPQSQKLIASMFNKPQSIVGHVTSETELADPLNDPQLLSETQDHWWVEAYLPNQGWVTLDPSFKNAEMGAVFTSNIQEQAISEIQDDLRHKVKVSLKIEEYHPLYAGSVNSGLNYSYPLEYTFRTVELVGESISLRHLVNTTAQGGATFQFIEHAYTPYLIVGDDIIEGEMFQTLTSNYPLGNFIVTAEWLQFEVYDPAGDIETHEREIVDLIGFEQREQGGQIAIDISNAFTQPIIDPIDQHTISIAVSKLSSQHLSNHYLNTFKDGQKLINTYYDSSNIGNRSDIQQTESLNTSINQINDVFNGLSIILGETFYLTSDYLMDQRQEAYLSRAYRDTSQIIIVSNEFNLSGEDINMTASIDLLHLEDRVVASPGQAKTVEFLIRMESGINNTALESQILSTFFDSPIVSVADVFAKAEQTDLATPNKQM